METAQRADGVMLSDTPFLYSDMPDVEVMRDIGKDQKDWADKMKFNEEMLTININTTSDPNAEPRVYVCVGGFQSHPQWGNYLPRGMDLKVKRYVAEALARAKPMNVTTREGVLANGDKTAHIMTKIGMAYPFNLVNGKPADYEWLKNIVAER